MNSMNRNFFEELPLATRALADDPNIRVIVVGAIGEHFSIGLNLKDQSIVKFTTQGSHAKVASQRYRQILQMQEALSVLSDIAQPTIASISGYCIGGALDLIAACDIRIACSNSIFSIRESKLAIVADLGSLQRLARIIPRGHLMELALTAEDFYANRAADIGLVNRIMATKDETNAEAVRIASAIANNSPLSTRGTKEILRGIYDEKLKDQLERAALWNGAFMQSNDVLEALSAFSDKRNPNFSGE